MSYAEIDFGNGAGSASSLKKNYCRADLLSGTDLCKGAVYFASSKFYGERFYDLS